MTITHLLFWLAIAWVVYANVGYLALLTIVSRFVKRPIVRAEITPAISFLIAARNEEKVIAAKLENTLALDYPADKLEIIVMSDASTDRTDEIVRGYAGRGVMLQAVPDGLGKPNAMNATVPLAGGEIILISDADSTYAPDALRKLVRSFADPEVGAVTGEERRVAAASGEGLGEGLYCRLDNQIKRLEGQMGSMVMVNGGFAAIRRELYPSLDPHLNFDLVWAPLLKLQGYRTAYEPEAVSVETYPLGAAGDFRRRIRTVLQAFYSYLAVPAALNPFRTGWYAFELFSHRFTRWFVVPWLAVALAANVALAGEGPLYLGLLAAQILCYGLALAGWLLDRAGKRVRLFYFPYYFFYIHLAAFVAAMQAMLGRRVATWAPTKRW
jgi:cellulose synthase/poly-beta-1,6-N-acetylglucosamine synthase-like glycosyltransferase